MIKFLKIFLIITLLDVNIPTMSAQPDSTEVKVESSSDTTLTKTVEDKESAKSWEAILPYIIGGLITGSFTLLGVYITLRHQRTVTQKQIDVETKRRLINDLMEVNKKVSLIIFETFKISHEVLKMIPNEITTKEKLEEARGKIELAMKIMDDKFMELMFWSGSVLLYISKTHAEHNNLKKLSNKLSKSYTNYHLYFNGNEIPIKEKENKLGDILQKRLSYYSDKIEELIDSERNNITNIFKINHKK